MTSRELLNCLTDRPCSVCKFRKENGCTKWDCVFDKKPEEECADAISRSDALNAVIFGSKEDMQANIIELPNVYPARQTSEWVYNFQSDKHYCKNCDAIRPATDYAFCPRCGCDMRCEE